MLWNLFLLPKPSCFSKVVPIWILSQTAGSYILTELAVNVTFITVICAVDYIVPALLSRSAC